MKTFVIISLLGKLTEKWPPTLQETVTSNFIKKQSSKVFSIWFAKFFVTAIHNMCGQLLL